MKKTVISSLLITVLTTILATQFSCAKLQKNEFERNRNLWQESGVKNYKMTVDIKKTGHATPFGKFVITVREGVAPLVQTADNLKTVSEYVKFEGLRTLDDIFRYIERMEKDGGSFFDRREIEYDAKLGYPKKANLDNSGVLDDELSFQVLEFEILE